MRLCAALIGLVLLGLLAASYAWADECVPSPVYGWLCNPPDQRPGDRASPW